MTIAGHASKLISTTARSFKSKSYYSNQIRYASTALPSSTASIDEKLVRLARQTLSKAAEAGSLNNGESSNDGEAAKKKKSLETLRDALRNWQETSNLRRSLEEVLDTDEDPDMRELAAMDLEAMEEQMNEAISKLQEALLPKDPTLALGCLIEIKSGVGGSEASIFAGDLYRMYSRFASAQSKDSNGKWKTEIISSSSVSTSTSSASTGTDAFREVILEIDGKGAFGLLRHEAGVHRVQRVPATESQGRVHTSTAAVVVLPSSSEHDTTMEDLIDEKDVKVEVMRSGGAGGQHVNRTESAVRLTHIPTGISVSIQETRSQHKNRAKAYQVLRSRLLALKIEEQQATDRAARRAQVRGHDRSEKIRTYNVAQDRVTDHRLPLTMNGVTGFLEGDDGSLEMMAGELNKWTDRMKIDDMLEAEA